LHKQCYNHLHGDNNIHEHHADNEEVRHEKYGDKAAWEDTLFIVDEPSRDHLCHLGLGCMV